MVSRILNSHLAQRLHGLGNHAQRLTGLLELPAGDGDHAVRFQVVKVFAEGFHGVEVVLAQRECARGGRGPGIHQGHLQHVILLF